mmetsp:Transcript_114142/g.317744  ORF Transcript_114142/g.317744 Transcript_114142/m.317744 type:complete len:204 (-) Transcript_114142:17-628(-)
MQRQAWIGCPLLPPQRYPEAASHLACADDGVHGFPGGPRTIREGLAQAPLSLEECGPNSARVGEVEQHSDNIARLHILSKAKSQASTPIAQVSWPPKHQALQLVPCIEPRLCCHADPSTTSTLEDFHLKVLLAANEANFAEGVKFRITLLLIPCNKKHPTTCVLDSLRAIIQPWKGTENNRNGSLRHHICILKYTFIEEDCHQ